MLQNNNPWIALSTYEECDEYRFYGREDDTMKLLSMLEQNDCIVIYAASGDGKSSVINAGLTPKMRKKGFFPIKIIFTSDELTGKNLPQKEGSEDIDFDKLIWGKINECLNNYKNNLQKNHNFDENYTLGFINIDNPDSQYEEGNLWRILRSSVIQDSLGVTDYIPVLIFDQFEEVLRCPWRSAFFKWLGILMKDTPSYRKDSKINENLHLRKLFKLIFSMRYEYVGELDYWCSQRYYIPQMMRNRYFLKPLSKNQALHIIKSNAGQDNISKKIADSAEVIIESITSNNHSSDNCDDEVPAIILSLTCHVLYDEWQDNEGLSLNEIGLSDIIYDYYKSITVVIGLSDNQRRVIERVLISSNGTRLRIPVSDERLSQENINNFLSGDKNLIEEHIIKCEKSNGETYIEFIHDKLAESIFKRREIENISLNKDTKSKHLKSILNIFSFLSLMLIFVLFSKYALLNELPEAVYIVEKTEDTDQTDASPINITINDFGDMMSDSIDFEHAQSLVLASKLDSCRSYRECYNNVLAFSVDKHLYIRYAGNAKQLTFPCKYTGSLKFGNNTEKVILFYPELVDSITTSSRLTKIYVPINKYEQTLLSPTFRDVTVVKMGYFQTFFEKLAFSLHHQHTHILKKQIPIWCGILISYGICIIVTLNSWIKYSFKQKIKYFIGFLFFVFLMSILFIESNWLGWSGNSFKFTYLFALACVCIVIIKLILNHIGKKVYKIDNREFKVAIVYTNKLTKKFAIEVKRYLLANGFIDNNINLDLLIYKNDTFDLNCFRNAVNSARHVIVILEESTINKDDPFFKKIWNTILLCRRFKHPIILGEIKDNSNLPKVLINKRGSGPLYPPLKINHKNYELEMSKLYKDLHSKFSPYQKIVFKYCVIIYVLLLIIIILSAVFL